MTTICEFCTERAADKTCRLGRPAPRGMGCRDFTPEMAEFFTNPSDFTGVHQVVQMATFFGLRGTEMKKVKLMATRAEQERTDAALDAVRGVML